MLKYLIFNIISLNKRVFWGKRIKGFGGSYVPAFSLIYLRALSVSRQPSIKGQ